MDLKALQKRKDEINAALRHWEGRFFKPGEYVGFLYDLNGNYKVATSKTGGDMKTATLYEGTDLDKAIKIYNSL